MAVNSVPIKIKSKSEKKPEFKPTSMQDQAKKRSSLKERQENKYHFPDSDVSSMLDYLLQANLIELPEMKRPEEVNQIDDPNYYKYHRLISHPVVKCFVLKDRIMELQRKGEITFDEENASSNATTVSDLKMNAFTISFGSLEPIIIEVSPYHEVANLQAQPITQHLSGGIIPKEESDGEGWILVTHRRSQKKVTPKSKSTPKRIKITRKPSRIPQCEKPKKAKASKLKKTSLSQRSEDGYQQKPRVPITLEEFMPKSFMNTSKSSVCYHTDGKEQEDDGEVEIQQKEHCSHHKTCTSCTKTISFTDEDLLLGSRFHIRPLFVTGFIRERKIK